MSHVPARIRTTPAQRSWPNAIRPDAKNVSTTPTTVTWFGVRGDRPSAEISASAWRRTQASNRVVNIGHLHRRSWPARHRLAGFVVDVDDIGRHRRPRVATGLFHRVVAEPSPQ